MQICEKRPAQDCLDGNKHIQEKVIVQLFTTYKSCLRRSVDRRVDLKILSEIQFNVWIKQ